MKALILVLIFLFSSLVLAESNCPDLTGKYSCDDGNDYYVDITWTQTTDSNGVQTYTATEDNHGFGGTYTFSIVSDYVIHDWPDLPGGDETPVTNRKYVSTCQNPDANTKALVTDETGTLNGKIQAHTAYTKYNNNPNGLSILMTGTSTDAQGNVQPLSGFRLGCLKQ